MKPLTIPDFKLKFLERGHIKMKNSFGAIMPGPHTFRHWCSRPIKFTDFEPVPDHLTPGFIKSKPKYFLSGIIPSSCYKRDDRAMRHLFRQISYGIPETKQRLIVFGHNNEEDKKITLFDLIPQKSLRKEYFNNDNDSYSCYDELVLSMIKNECVLASVKILEIG